MVVTYADISLMRLELGYTINSNKLCTERKIFCNLIQKEKGKTKLLEIALKRMVISLLITINKCNYYGLP